MRAMQAGCAVAILLGASAWAQSVNPPMISVLGAAPAPAVPSIVSSRPDIAPERGLPYSMEETRTTERTLADGTHITNEEKQKLVRDSEGRLCTVFYNKLRDMPYVIAIINDPVAHESIVLNGWEKTAEVTHTHPFKPHPLTPEQRAKIEAMRAKADSSDAKQKGPQRPEAPSIENLGSRSIDGIYVEGRRSTTIIPIGQIGNDHELRRVLETWTSPELKVALDQTFDDPVNGRTMTKVTSIDRGDPDPSLFRVPEGYRVMDKNPEAAVAAQP